MTAFSYSPAHALLWVASTETNWLMIFVIMVVLIFQVRYIAEHSGAEFTQRLQLRGFGQQYGAVVRNKKIITVLD